MTPQQAILMIIQQVQKGGMIPTLDGNTVLQLSNEEAMTFLLALQHQIKQLSCY